MAETLAFDYARVARIFNTYGSRMRRDEGRIVSNAVTQALAGDPITIYGDGSQTRSFCYVDDLVEGLRRLQAPPRGAVNCGNPEELTVADLAERVGALTGSKSSIVRRPLPVDDPRRRRPDVTYARRVLGWAPRVGLEAGLRSTSPGSRRTGTGPPRYARRRTTPIPAMRMAPAGCRSRCRSGPKAISRRRRGGRSAAPPACSCAPGCSRC